MSKLLIIIGIALIIIGLIWHYFPSAWSWLGRLPGDIRIENDNSKVFIPITSMILINLALTVILNLIKRFL